MISPESARNHAQAVRVKRQGRQTSAAAEKSNDFERSQDNALKRREDGMADGFPFLSSMIRITKSESGRRKGQGGAASRSST